MISRKLALIGFLGTITLGCGLIIADTKAEAETCIPYNVGNCDPGDNPFGNGGGTNSSGQIYNAPSTSNSSYQTNNSTSSSVDPQQAQDSIVQALHSGNYQEALDTLNNTPEGQALQEAAPDYAQRVESYIAANPINQAAVPANQIQYPDSFSSTQIAGLNSSMDVNNFGMGQILQSTMAIANDPVQVLQQLVLNHLQNGRTEEAKTLLNSSPQGEALKQEIPNLEQKMDSYIQSREYIEDYVANSQQAGR